MVLGLLLLSNIQAAKAGNVFTNLACCFVWSERLGVQPWTCYSGVSGKKNSFTEHDYQIGNRRKRDTRGTAMNICWDWRFRYPAELSLAATDNSSSEIWQLLTSLLSIRTERTTKKFWSKLIWYETFVEKSIQRI